MLLVVYLVNQLDCLRVVLRNLNNMEHIIKHHCHLPLCEERVDYGVKRKQNGFSASVKTYPFSYLTVFEKHFGYVFMCVCVPKHMTHAKLLDSKIYILFESN